EVFRLSCVSRNPHYKAMTEFRGLRALNHAERLAVECRRIADSLPPNEHELADQLRRAATSVALNIAEGSLCTSSRDYRRFLDTARSGLKEVEVILRLVHKAGYIDDATFGA